jgi:hypothetical protein
MVDCQHYWHIDEVHGPTSWGRCTQCGLQREFSNHAETGFDWLHLRNSPHDADMARAGQQRRKQQKSAEHVKYSE